MKSALLAFGAASLFLGLCGSPALAQSWTYQVNPSLDFQTRCVNPQGNVVGGWVDCRTNGTCNNAAAITARCVAQYASLPGGTTPKFVMSTMKIDMVRAPRSLLGTVADCANNTECAAALKAVSASTGIPLDQVATVAALVTPGRQGETGWSTLQLPSGYEYCSSEIKTVSIVPRDGPRGSMITARVGKSSLYVEAWTPEQPVFGGNSWAEADITLVGVRSDAASQERSVGKCQPSNSPRHILRCRGSGCEGTTLDKGQAVAVNPPPEAGSRNN